MLSFSDICLPIFSSASVRRIALATLFGATITGAWAAPARFPYDVKLTAAQGVPTTGEQLFVFSLFQGGSATEQNSGLLVYSETISLTITNGAVNHVIGTGKTVFGEPLNSDKLDTSLDVYVQVTVGDRQKVLLPRRRLNSVPYAMNAGDSDSLGGRAAADYMLLEDYNSVTTKNAAAVPGTGAGSTIGGGTSNTASGAGSTASGGSWNDAVGDYSTVGGGWDNNSNGRTSTLSGGSVNRAVGELSTIAGGEGNQSTEKWSFIGGGLQNIAGYLSAVSGGYQNKAWNYSTIAGGWQNWADGVSSSIGGGANNLARNQRSTVSGGYKNKAVGEFSAVAGGNENTASGLASSIGGGKYNKSIGDSSTIAGGFSNRTHQLSPYREDIFANGAAVGGGQSNTAFGHYSCIAGGLSNTASGQYSSIAGGWSNIASAEGGAIGGGFQNQALSYGSVAGGHKNVAVAFAAVGGGSGCRAYGDNSTIGGGQNNIVYGDVCTIGGGADNSAGDEASSSNYTTIGGGYQNSALGHTSTVPGGHDNHADAAYSFAAGARAKATHLASFVWNSNDGNDTSDFTSTGEQTFNVRATGGAWFSNNLSVASVTIRGGSDVAEPFRQANGNKASPGTVMVIDENNAGKLKPSTGSYDRKVAGIVSGAGGVNPGITLTQEGALDGEVPVAMAGRVYVKASTDNGPINPGDLLTTAETDGHAMKATDGTKSHGAVLGKAMTELKEGTGLVLVLVNLQ